MRVTITSDDEDWVYTAGLNLKYFISEAQETGICGFNLPDKHIFVKKTKSGYSVNIRSKGNEKEECGEVTAIYRHV